MKPFLHETFFIFINQDLAYYNQDGTWTDTLSEQSVFPEEEYPFAANNVQVLAIPVSIGNKPDLAQVKRVIRAVLKSK